MQNITKGKTLKRQRETLHKLNETDQDGTIIIKRHPLALTGVGQWVGPQSEGSLVRFLVRAPAWVVASVPSRGAHRSPETDVSLPRFLSHLPSL